MLKVTLSTNRVLAAFLVLITAAGLACSSDSAASGVSSIDNQAREENPTPEVQIEMHDAARDPALLEQLAIKTLPDELTPDQATTQSETRVEELWANYLADSLVPISLVNPSLGDLHLCSAGVIAPRNVGLTNMPHFDHPDSWWVDRNAAMSASKWWEASLVIALNPEVNAPADSVSVMTLSVEDGVLRSSFHNSPTDIPVYESEYCQALSG